MMTDRRIVREARPHSWICRASLRRASCIQAANFSNSCPARMFSTLHKRLGKDEIAEYPLLPEEFAGVKLLTESSTRSRDTSLGGDSGIFHTRREVVDWIRASCDIEQRVDEIFASNAYNSPCGVCPKLSATESHGISESLRSTAFHSDVGRQISSFDFDALSYDEDNLADLCLKLFSLLKVEDLSIDQAAFRLFVLKVRRQMVENPYHNWFHVVDVAQAAYSLALQSGLLHEMSSTERLALLVAALCHDLDHPGVTNAFLIKTRSALASQYAMDASCLEKHHSCRASELLSNDERSGLLDGLEPAPRQQIMECVERIIMATDMGRHGEYVARLSSLAARRRQGAEEGGAAERRHVVVAVDDEERHTMTELLIKCADMSNVLKPFPVAKKWAMRITDEFFKQGDLERSLGMDVTPTCDRHSQSRVALQKGFIAFVRPFYRAVGDLLPALRPLADRLQSTLDMWETYASDEALLAEM